MNIAIIGAGAVGAALAGSFARAGHDVTISSAKPEDAQQMAASAGVRAAASNSEAVAAGDYVVLAVPYAALPQVLDEVGEGWQGKVIIDATNPMRPDYSGLATGVSSAAEEIQTRVPTARVVKAFNTAFAARQADPTVDGAQVDGFVAGDDDEARRAVLELSESIGFRPVDAGPLEMARALEGMAALNITLQLRNNWPWQSAWKLMGPTVSLT